MVGVILTKLRHAWIWSSSVKYLWVKYVMPNQLPVSCDILVNNFTSQLLVYDLTIHVFHNYKCTLYSIIHSLKRWILQNVKGIWEFFFFSSFSDFSVTDLKRKKKTRLNKLKVEVSQSCPEWVTSKCDNVKCVLTTHVHCWLRGGTKVLIDKYSVRAISF